MHLKSLYHLWAKKKGFIAWKLFIRVHKKRNKQSYTRYPYKKQLKMTIWGKLLIQPKYNILT